METVFAKVSFIQLSHRLLRPRACLTKIKGVCGGPKNRRQKLTLDLRRAIPDITYSPSLLSVSAADLELDATQSSHPYGGGKQDWTAKSYLNDSTNSHQTVLGGYQATASKASWQFSSGSLSPFQSTLLCLACAFCL